MTPVLDPIDLFEVGLRRGTARGGDLLQLDFPTALEFSALRFYRWQKTGEDLLASFPELESWPALGRLRALASHCEILQLDKRRSLPFSSGDTRVGIQQFSTSVKEWEPGGIFAHFQEQFRTALRNHGMRVDFASALAGALQEMTSNAIEHADSPARPIACFEVGRGSWSFGVVDVGRGVFKSLKDNPRYQDLPNETQALTLALQPGVSRVTNSGRGMGFTSVFKALVDHRAVLRFRSGGASVSWEGESPTDQSIHARSLPLSRNGFCVRIAGPLNGA